MVVIDLRGRRALVGGASAGIGAATARILARCGAQVCLMARSETDLSRLLPELEGTGHSYVAVDFGNPDAVDRVLEHFNDWGYPHIFVNNSGGPAAGPLLEAEPMAFLKALQQHLFFAHQLIRHFLPFMKQAQYGRIINVLSTSVREPILNLGVSNVTRAAVASWTKTLSKEIRDPNITFNNLLPGYTRTERLERLIQLWAQKEGMDPKAYEQKLMSQVPLQRFADPEEIGYAIAFLASPLSSYINGVSLPVDGGRLNALA